MLTTVDVTKRVTGYDVSPELLYKAQAIVEVYCGRVESDITNRRDRSLLSRAVAYQAAYMRDNSDRIFEQASLAQAGQSDSIVTYKAGDDSAPWVAPLAVISCKKLSWFKSRSVKTGRNPVNKPSGKYFDRDSDMNWWND